MGGEAGPKRFAPSPSLGERLSLIASGLAAGAKLRWETEWFGSPLHLAALRGRRPAGLILQPRDPRPADPEKGRQILAGAFLLGGSALHLGQDGDPWDRPSPSQAFAFALHRFGWLPHVVATGEAGRRQALRLYLDWRRVFGRWNAFSWQAAVLDRRVTHLACAARPLAAAASEAEAALLAHDLARQARHLLKITQLPNRAVERAAAAALAGAVLAGEAGERLMTQGLDRLADLLPRLVLADGGHATRSPQAGLELLFDLLTLDDALVQRGRNPPEALSRAIDRLSGAVRFFTLADGALAAFQGGEAAPRARVAAALAHDDGAARPPQQAVNSGYQRLTGDLVQVIVDAGAPAEGPLSLTACGQPAAIEVVCGGERLIVGGGWSPQACAPHAMRMTDAASTLCVADGSAGAPLHGGLAKALGPRLIGGARKVGVWRQETDAGVWVDVEHDGWAAACGLLHQRRLFLNLFSEELRGEDALAPVKPGTKSGPRRYVPFAVRFQLHPDARASVARDNKSVLVKGPSNIGWWLRNDAVEVAVEPGAVCLDGVVRRSTQIVLRGRARVDQGARIRWKLVRAEA